MLDRKLFILIQELHTMSDFDLAQALHRVYDVRSKPKLTKSQKVWFEVFDELYGNRIKSSNDIIDIILEQGNKK